MKQKIHDAIKNLYNLYHRNESHYDNKTMLEIGFAFLIFSVFLTALYHEIGTNSKLDLYTIALLLITGVFMISSSSYLCGNEQFSIFQHLLSFTLYFIVIIAFTIVFILPVFLLFLTQLFLLKKAKKTINIQMVICFYLLDLWTIVVYLLVETKLGLVKKFAYIISNNLNLKSVTMQVIFDTGVIILLIYLLNELLIGIYKYFNKKNIVKPVSLSKNELEDMNTYKEYVNYDYQSDSDYDYKYVKFSLYKLNLMSVVVAFILVMISNDNSMSKIFPDVSIAVTVISLVILVFDKYREWSRF